MSEESEIPLFPLNVVLFPYSKLPLYIFEERYKKMINDSIAAKTLFGINLFTDGKMYNIGCSALVNELLDTAPTGEMNIIIKGVDRYKIIKHELSGNGFYTARIEFLNEDNTNHDKAKLEKSVKIYNDFVDIVYKGSVRKIDLNDMKWYDGRRSVAFTIAEKSGLNLTERQDLL